MKQAITQGVDLAILSLGVNDIRAFRTAPAMIESCLLKLVDQFVAIGVPTIVTTVGPVQQPEPDAAMVNAAIRELNGLVRARWPNAVDFDTAFAASSFLVDGVHPNEAGQKELADRSDPESDIC